MRHLIQTDSGKTGVNTSQFPLRKTHRFFQHVDTTRRTYTEREMFSKGRSLWYHYTVNFGYSRELDLRLAHKLALRAGLPSAFVTQAIKHYLTH